MSDRVAAQAAACGIATGYHDYEGAWIEPPSETIEALIDIMGPAPSEVASSTEGLCYWDENTRTWGWAAQLYALRSHNSWGIGDFADLSVVARWTADRGGLLMLSPMNAGSVGPRRTESPYYPSSRLWLDPIYIDLNRAPGFSDEGSLGALAERGRGLNRGNLIDRDLTWAVKSAVLDELWSAFGGDANLEVFKASHPSLKDYATFCAICEVHGERWRLWPDQLRSPKNAAVEEFRSAHGDRVAFFEWLQWLAADQLASASGRLITDLAVGIDPNGADAWLFGSQILENVTIGAPPDEFNTQGQDWKISGFHPHRILPSNGEAFRTTIASAMRHAAGIRIDHVMGLFRLYLIPEGASPREGTYVSFPHEQLLGWLADESQASECFVVGEDLGTVQPVVRASMRRRRMLAYRVMMSAKEPAAYPVLSIGAITTHDLPTIAGLVSGSDLQDQLRLGLEPNRAATEKVRLRFVEMAGSADIPEVTSAAHRALARSPSAIVVATFQDALGMASRPNMPGTVDAWPNWRLPLSAPIEDVLGSEQVEALVSLLSARAVMPT